jgi:hypothetical protein
MKNKHSEALKNLKFIAKCNMYLSISPIKRQKLKDNIEKFLEGDKIRVFLS